MSRPQIILVAALAVARASAEEPATSRWPRVEAALTLLEQRHLAVSPAELESGLLAGLVLAADPAGRVIPADGFADFERAGAGVTANPGWKLSATNHQVVFQEAVDAACNPAIPPGWLVTSIDGRPTVTNSWSSVNRMLRRTGPGSVLVGLADPVKGATTNLSVQLAPMPEPAVARCETWLGDVQYVRLNGIPPRSGPELQEALKPAPSQRGLILDLRDAGGADMDAVLAAAALFCGPDRVLARWKGPDDSGASDLRSAPWVGPMIETPVLVLINARTRGASELLAALLARCARGALLVGEPASGDPLLRESIPLDNGPVLHLATRKLVFSEGATLDARNALTPDVPVGDNDLQEPADDGIRLPLAQNHLRAADTAAHAAGVHLQNRIRHDAVLKRAVDIMLGLRALPPKSR